MNRGYRQPAVARVTARQFVPAASILVSILLMMLPLPLAWGVMPNFALLLLIIWSRIQPRLLPPWSAFLLGLFADTMIGLPLGIFATLFPLTAVLARAAEARFEGKDLVIDWGVTSLLLLVAHLFAFQLLNFAGRAPALWPMLAQAVISSLAYPVATMVAARLQRWMVGSEG